MALINVYFHKSAFSLTKIKMAAITIVLTITFLIVICLKSSLPWNINAESSNIAKTSKTKINNKVLYVENYGIQIIERYIIAEIATETDLTIVISQNILVCFSLSF